MYIPENFLIIILVLSLFALSFYFSRKKNISKLDEQRVEQNLKIYIDKDFKECIEIISNKLNKEEFDKMCMVLYNLRNGYDYGFQDSINFAFYNEVKSIKNNRKKNKCESKVLRIIK